MFRRNLFAVLFGLLFAGILVGCSGSGSPVIPSSELSAPKQIASGPSNRVLWGYYNVSIDPLSMQAEVTPLRGAEFTANVTRFMQPPLSPTNMVSFSVDGSSDPATGYFAVDVTVKHPFPGISMYNGFDVRGILFAGAEPGLWDVVVEVSTGVEGTLEDAFTVLDAIFVDGDNAGDPSEDGSMDHPFDTIQEGIDAAYISADEPVIVDQATDPYSPFRLQTNSHVIGCNWNDGTGWAVVEQTYMYTYGSSVNNVTIEGLFFDITINSGDTGMHFSSGDGINIKECKFTGEVNTTQGRFILFAASQNVEISYCEFTEIFQRCVETYWRALYIVRGDGTNGFSVHHSEFHDIGYDEWDAGEYGTSLHIIRVGYGSGPPHNVDFHHLLIYDIYNKTDCVRPSPNPDPQNALGIFSLSNINSWDWVGDFKLYNITVDNVRHADPPDDTIVNAGHVNGGYFGMIGGDDIDWKNNIVSNVEPTDDYVVYGNTSYYGWWVDGYVNGVPGGQAMDYSLCFNIGKPLPPGENWSSGWNSGWCNQVHEGVGCYSNDENVDPEYDMTPGDNFYHPTNSLIAEGADDGTEMGAFGGPDGDWVAFSQIWD